MTPPQQMMRGAPMMGRGQSMPSMDPSVRNAIQWLYRLDQDRALRAITLSKYDAYYRGTQSLMFATSKFRESFAGMFTNFADNWCKLVVDAVGERLKVEGFRFPNDNAGEKKAWNIWQANFLDSDSQLGHTEALINGMAYALVWPTDDPKMPKITVEDPQQMIVAHEPGETRQRQAALKVWLDDNGLMLATLYLPDAIWKFQTRSVFQSGNAWWGTQDPAIDTGGVQTMTDIALRQFQSAWQPREVPGEPWPLPNPLGCVPVVPLYNDPRLRTGGQSELVGVIPLQDAVNKLLADMLVSSEFAAFRQRWATGLEVPNDPETEEPMEPFKAAVDRLWISDSKDTTFGEFNVTDLTNYTSAIEMIVQHIATQSRTPPHYFYLSGQFPSGESIKSAEAGLVSKAHNRTMHFGESWEEVMRLALLASGDAKRAQVVAMETVWRDVEYRTESLHIDATVKLRALEVPLPALWERAGFSPTEIARFKEMRAEEKALGLNETLIDSQDTIVEKPPTVKI
jgi:hypothetical protein